jgi:hypothetical protein
MVNDHAIGRDAHIRVNRFLGKSDELNFNETATRVIVDKIAIAFA